ncbi:MAG: ATP-dependent Clp protease proteolytic subunit [Candidatus Paceibacterota bacterium]|jgi:ATP-dependent protease ClpP protease subunit
MNVIPFNGIISGSRIENLLNVLRRDCGRSLVVVNSPGGEFEFFSKLAPALMRTGFVSVGNRVASAAIVLQLLGRERLATPNATFFFHEVRTILGAGGEVTICDLERFLDMEREMKENLGRACREEIEMWHQGMAAAQAWMLRFIRQQTGLSAGTFANLMRGEVTLSAREAVQYGIVHRVVSYDELMSYVDPRLL